MSSYTKLVCLGKLTKSKHLCFDYSVALVLLYVKISQPVQYFGSRFEKKMQETKNLHKLC